MIGLALMLDSYANEKGFGPRIVYVPETGFATYHLNKDECYIEDLYVIPSKRKSGAASDMADSIAAIARDCGIKVLTCSVNLTARGKEAAMKTILAYGFSPVATSGENVYFSKEI